MNGGPISTFSAFDDDKAEVREWLLLPRNTIGTLSVILFAPDQSRIDGLRSSYAVCRSMPSGFSRAHNRQQPRQPRTLTDCFPCWRHGLVPNVDWRADPPQKTIEPVHSIPVDDIRVNVQPRCDDPYLSNYLVARNFFCLDTTHSTVLSRTVCILMSLWALPIISRKRQPA
jgi:hypothetical protein